MSSESKETSIQQGRLGAQSASLLRPNRTFDFGESTKTKPQSDKKPVGYERKVQSAMSMRRFEEYIIPSKETILDNNQKKNKEADKESLFEDKNLYQVYLDLCAQRDNVPERSASRIEALKKKDPVFAKRYKQFLTAKNCNKAPNFDLNDYLIPVTMPKSALLRKKDQIIKEVNEERERSAKMQRAEMQLIEKKIKVFVQNISSF